MIAMTNIFTLTPSLSIHVFFSIKQMGYFEGPAIKGSLAPFPTQHWFLIVIRHDLFSVPRGNVTCETLNPFNSSQTLKKKVSTLVYSFMHAFLLIRLNKYSQAILHDPYKKFKLQVRMSLQNCGAEYLEFKCILKTMRGNSINFLEKIEISFGLEAYK